jgi:signal transduction histidine kinase
MIEALRQVPLFANAPDQQLQWLATQGTEIWLSAGEVLITEGEPALYWYVLLEGELRITKKTAGQEAFLNTYQPGTFFGEVPILLGTPYVASARARRASYLLRLEKDSFWQLMTTCSALLQAILQKMAERVQDLQSFSQQHEKLIALGTLAAGLAHELNNPAAAVSRDASQLDEIFQALPSLTLTLNQQRMTPEQLLFLSDLQRNMMQRATTSSRIDPLTQSDREDEVTDWLEAHGVPDGWKLASTLVRAGLETEWLDTLVEHLAAASIGDVLPWLEAILTGRGLLEEIKQGSTRISELVKAIKDYSYLDQAPLQEVDVHEGIENTLIILTHKLKQGGIVVTREFDQNLPRISAYGSELNQVWTNLIDNAIDALGAQGRIWLRTSQEDDYVVVEVADNGPGIPPDIQPHIFEPFFTTKGVGEGTGLGLVTSYRVVVGMHQGDIRVFSKPGDTHFQVRLPINPHQVTHEKETFNMKCSHLDQIQAVTPSANGCEECLAMGDRWVHLRLCLSCGHIGCCDSSKNKHATQHFHATNHPIVKSFQPGEDWSWCYIDKTFI